MPGHPKPDPGARVPGEVRELADQRAAARRARDFVAADALRDRITEMGWILTDGPGGYVLTPAARAGQARPDYEVGSDPSAVPAAGSHPGGKSRATVALLVEGWPEDLRACVAALLEHAPAGVVISALDVGNVDGAGDALHELAASSPARIGEWHVAGSAGWSAGRNALLRADAAPVHVIMETSTILTGDAISPLLDAVAEEGVVAAGWRGADPDPDMRGFHDAGPGHVTALLGYLLAVRTSAALEVGGLPPLGRFYRNADLEFSLRLGRLGRLVVPASGLPARQTRHRGYHDSDPELRDRESRRNYRRVLSLLRDGQAGPG
jgi:hypothetical protein